MGINEQILRADRHYKRLSAADIATIKEKAPHLASILVTAYPQHKIMETLLAAGFEVIETENAEQSLIKYRARIEIGKAKKIFLYTDSISEMTTKFPDVTSEQARLMFIAHEFIHYLEHIGEIDTSYTIMARPFIFRKELEIHAFSEMVANHYAMLVTNSKINPMEIDKENNEL